MFKSSDFNRKEYWEMMKDRQLLGQEVRQQQYILKMAASFFTLVRASFIHRCNATTAFDFKGDLVFKVNIDLIGSHPY